VVVVVEEPAVEVLIAERRLEGVEVHPDQYALQRDATHPNGIVCGEWSGIRVFEKAFDAKSAKEARGFATAVVEEQGLLWMVMTKRQRLRGGCRLRQPSKLFFYFYGSDWSEISCSYFCTVICFWFVGVAAISTVSGA
jgi:hypothetical protein